MLAASLPEPLQRSIATPSTGDGSRWHMSALLDGERTMRGSPSSERPIRRYPSSSCIHDTLGRVLGLSIKAGILIAQHVLDLSVLWRYRAAGEQDWEQRQYLSEIEWWWLVVGTAMSTLLAAAVLKRHRCAARRNRPYGFAWALLLSTLQVGPLAEMIDKLGDGVCWGVPDDDMFGSVGSVILEMKGSRYGENLMRGLRKLSIASLPISLLSTWIHLYQNFLVWAQDDARDSMRCEGGCRLELAALIVGFACLSMAFADIVLYAWVDDAFVRSHKKLVLLHYIIEIVARLPAMSYFFAAMLLTGNDGGQAVTILWLCDASANMLLMLGPTFIAWVCRGSSLRHALSQLFTAFLASQVLFGVNIALFDPRDAFTTVNMGFYLVKYVELWVMMKLVHGRMPESKFLVFFCEVQVVVTLVNAAIVWIYIPYRHRVSDDNARRAWEPFPRLTQLRPPVDSPTPAHRHSTRSVFHNPGRALDLELGTVVDPQVARRISRPAANAEDASDEYGSVLECLGDILEALCLMSQSHSWRNKPTLTRAMVVDVLWALVLPWEGVYDDGSGGTVRIQSLELANGSVLLLHEAGPEQALVDLRPRSCPAQSEADDSGPRVVESLALVFQGTALQVAWEGEGRIIGFFDGRCIRFADKKRTIWKKHTPPAAPRRDGPDLDSVQASGSQNTHVNGGQSRVSPIAVAAPAQEILQLVLAQLVLALRWEPTFLGLPPSCAPAETQQAGGLAAVDASQRPLLSFLVRYALTVRDDAFLAEMYWSLWCLSNDHWDNGSGAYDKARWVVVAALRGEVEFWDGACSIRLDNTALLSEDAVTQSYEFRNRALRLLLRQRQLWKQSIQLAQLQADMHTDAAERTRAVQRSLYDLTGRARAISTASSRPPRSSSSWTLLARNSSVGGKPLLETHNTSAGTTAGDSVSFPLPEHLKVASDLDSEDMYLLGTGEDLAPLTLVDTGNASFVSMPIDPGVPFLGLNISGCRVLPSNAAPLLLSCRTLPPSSKDQEQEASAVSSNGGALPTNNSDGVPDDSHLLEYMVKVGDDLRQDQLVLQMLAIMRRVWRERLPSAEHAMLHLAPYRVLAMTPRAGYVKFVPGAVALSKVVSTSRGNLKAWLEQHRPRSMTLSQVMRNLCGSVAAYCVATYVLGIGDRHLDNLLITPSGHFFHIDFAFIFGEDPKPFAPRLRLPQQVASALLSVRAEGSTPSVETLLDQCFLLAGRAYIALRRSMHLWTSLLRITGEAGGAGCARLRARADAAVVFVRERLRSDLGDFEEEAAAADFLLILCESTEALYPTLTDKVHQFGLFLK